MLSTAVANCSHVLLTCFYDVCDGFHAKNRLYEHFTPSPYPRLPFAFAGSRARGESDESDLGRGPWLSYFLSIYGVI